MTRGTTRQTLAAADALRDWLHTQRPRPGAPSAAIAPASPESGSADTSAAILADLPGLATADLPHAELGLVDTLLPAVWPTQATDPEITEPLRLPHTDWLHHRLTVSGPREPIAALQAAAAGAGVIPWQLDLDRLEEDLFHALVAPPPPHLRRLSLAGARILAGQLREAVARRHALAVSRVGESRACPLDLHTLLPVPPDLLARGPDDPAVLAWLWTQWGTTEALRQVTVVTAPFPDEPAAPVPDEAAFRVIFWSADWTPWRALAQLAARWPALRFVVRPTYEAA